MNKKKYLFSFLLFLIVMAATFYAMLGNNQLPAVFSAMRNLKPLYLILAFISAVLFVCGEGFMIWYLLHSVGEENTLIRCFGYSFVGFFFSGITPSASGGQPVQLYYMKKDGASLSKSTAVLMTVAVAYKFIMVLWGLGLLILWGGGICRAFGAWFWLYLLGLGLNIVVTAVLIAAMLRPGWIRKAGSVLLAAAFRLGIWKGRDSAARLEEFLEGYRGVVLFLKGHLKKLIMVVVATFFQRLFMFLTTWFIFCGFSIEGISCIKTVALQAAVYAAVDMLPVPGAQGITELMFQQVFAGLVPGALLVPSLCAVRGINFYLMMCVSILVMLVFRLTGAARAPGGARWMNSGEHWHIFCRFFF